MVKLLVGFIAAFFVVSLVPTAIIADTSLASSQGEPLGLAAALYSNNNSAIGQTVKCIEVYTYNCLTECYFYERAEQCQSSSAGGYEGEGSYVAGATQPIGGIFVDASLVSGGGSGSYGSSQSGQGSGSYGSSQPGQGSGLYGSSQSGQGSGSYGSSQSGQGSGSYGSSQSGQGSEGGNTPVQIPACAIPTITSFVPYLNGKSFDNKDLPTYVRNGRAQVVTYNPILWGDFGIQGNMPNLVVCGTGQPGTQITLFKGSEAQSGYTLNTAVVASNGTWSCEVPFSAFDMSRKILWNESNLDGWLTDSDGIWQAFTVQCSCGASHKSTINVGSGYVTPIAIDFSGIGKIETVTAQEAPNAFDFGDKGIVGSGWLAPSAGFLVWDKNEDGQINSVGEMFGGSIGLGFKSLAELDSNGDGIIDAKDPAYHFLKIWRDFNLSKTVDTGELFTLEECGIEYLCISHVDYMELDPNGNAVYEHSYAMLTNGQKAAMNDVYFAIAD